MDQIWFKKMFTPRDGIGTLKSYKPLKVKLYIWKVTTTYKTINFFQCSIINISSKILLENRYTFMVNYICPSIQNINTYLYRIHLK